MKKSISLLISLPLLMSCAGSPAWHSIKMNETAGIAQKNNRNIMDLKIGDSKESVLKSMGMPDRREVYQLEGNRSVEFLFFRTLAWSYDDTGDQDKHFTPFAFEQNRLTGWGRNFYDKVVQASVELTVKK